MLQLFERRPDNKSAHVFADHLEATLDLAEELELLHLVLPGPEDSVGADVLAVLDRVGAFVERIEVIELAITAKLELARAAARRTADRDARLSTFSRLFHAGTQPLVDLWPSLADPGGRIFDSGHDALTFLQARGTIDESRCTLEGIKFLGTGEDYLLLGTVKLGTFIELCDTCRKAIDRHYHLYEDDDGWETARTDALDALRGRRDEAIRQALGAEAAIIEAPVEIVPQDAVDEAIDLIEGLTFPEESRFEAAPAAVELATEEELPVELAVEIAEEAPVELATEALELETPAAVTVDAATPDVVSLEAALWIEPELSAVLLEEARPAPADTMPVVDTMPVSPSDASDAPAPVLTVPAIAPRTDLLAPLAHARRSLVAFLTRWRATPDATLPTGQIELADVGDDVDSDSVESAIEALSSSVLVADVENSVALQAGRRRLVDLIAARAGELREAAPNSIETGSPDAEIASEPANSVPVGEGELAETTPEMVEASASEASMSLLSVSEPEADVVETAVEAISNVATVSPAKGRPRRHRKGRVPRRRRTKRSGQRA